MRYRDRVETDLENLLDDVAADGTALDPNRDSEPEYQRLGTLCNNLNREMLAIYAQFLCPLTTEMASRK
jgi:hypothetical protein